MANFELTESQEQAYNALSKCAGKIGLNNYKAQLAEHLKKGRSKKTFKFFVTDAHRLVIQAMDDLCANKITPEQAMGIMLYDYSVNKERFFENV